MHRFLTLVGLAAMLAGTDPATALEVCRGAQGEKPVPVWTPRLTRTGDLVARPPENDSQIVYVAFSANNDRTGCLSAKPSKLYPFTFMTNKRDIGEGGIVANIRGNVVYTSGSCAFEGFYLNEKVSGIHQGFTETYFGAVPKEKIAFDGHFCLVRKP